MKDFLASVVFGERYTNGFETIFNELRDCNLINIGELFELAVSRYSGIPMCPRNTPNIDIVTNYQLKHAQTYPEQLLKDKMYAYLSVEKTTAPILAGVHERLTNKMYFFHFPPEAYTYIRANTIKIPFTNYGAPIYVPTKNTGINWWSYKLNTFDELCNIAKVPTTCLKKA